ncbi:hypothetical protein LJY25_06105 [Hymenobacter sp. BT175]|uniref:hypothetical protein n=1 Tax=Hymenobacter translucens TaxID=2886507 RepID=UPI001D0E7CAC|nr:hypothetical protein [Hymenobacter translucens]MCC2546010.1 hypothetical protein [Hymenobacter translucens]
MNRFSLSGALLFAGLLLSVTFASAQTTPGQPTLDEQKAQIWCATVRFIYDEAGKSDLKNSVRCGGSLKEFESSIKADSQKVYSLLYAPLEARGTMYSGLGSDKSRLQKLATEIINKLKSSPSRRKDPARMQGVQDLDAQLKGYVENGTPPTDVGASLAAAQTPQLDTTATDEEMAATETAGTDPVDNSYAATSRSAGSGESMMSKLFAPIALILSLLSLFLYVLLRRSISALGSRADRHRSELESVKATAGGFGGGGGGVAAGLTPDVQREIERIVQQRVAAEVARLQSGNAGQSQHQPRKEGQSNKQQRQQQNAPRPAPAAAPPAAAPAAAEAPTSYAPPAPMRETEPAPAAMPLGSPATENRDEFDSLIPPVQLPATDWSAATAPVQPAAAPAPPANQRFYVKVPVNGGFSEYDLQDQPQHDSIYEITLDPQRPGRASFRITSNTAVHAYAIQSAQYSLRDACQYQQPTGPVSRIVTDKDGVLNKANGAWQVEQKAAIHFE